jgi:hypothetical protein
MAMQYSSIYNCKTLQNFLKFGFLGLKKCYLATLVCQGMIWHFFRGPKFLSLLSVQFVVWSEWLKINRVKSFFLPSLPPFAWKKT